MPVGALGRSRLTIGIDVNFGVPNLPEPSLVELPRVVQLGQAPVVVLGYPLTMVLAEKIVTAVDRGAANTRWRDFADVYTIIRVHNLHADELIGSMGVVAEYRGVELRPLLPMLAQMPQRAQSKWRAWRKRVNREDDLPLEFAEMLNAVANFSDPALTRAASRGLRAVARRISLRRLDERIQRTLGWQNETLLLGRIPPVV